MLTRYWDRRRFIRVPASGVARWQSAGRHGHCQLVDLSPGGVGLRMPLRKATQLGPSLSLEIEMTPGVVQRILTEGRVIRRAPAEDGQCIVGIECSPDQWAD